MPASGKILHGYVGTRIYRIWKNMKSRCNHKSMAIYKYYGGRGITFCDEWDSFIPFMEWALNNGYDENLTLDRIDNNGDYSPDNCRWVTMTVQNRNTRKNRKVVRSDGVMYLSVTEAAEMNGARQQAIDLVVRGKRSSFGGFGFSYAN